MYCFCIVDCETTLPIYANPASTEAREIGLTSETSFVASRLGLAVVALLLWLFCGVFGMWRDFVFLFRPNTAYGMYQAALPHFPLYYCSKGIFNHALVLLPQAAACQSSSPC